MMNKTHPISFVVPVMQEIQYVLQCIIINKMYNDKQNV